MPITNNLFQLTFPDGWKETTVYTFEGPHDGGVQHNLVLIIDPFVSKDVSLQDYTRAQLAGPMKSMPGFEMMGEVEKQLPDGTRALEIVYKYVPAENYVLYQKQLYFFKDKKAFVFTGTFSKKTLKTIAYEFDAIAASFLVVKPVEQD